MSEVLLPADGIARSGQAWHLVIVWPDASTTVPASEIIAQPQCARGFTLRWQRRIQLAAVGGLRFALHKNGTAGEELLAATEDRPVSVPLVRLFASEEATGAIFEGQVTGWKVHGSRIEVEALHRWPWSPEQTLCRDLARLVEGRQASLPLGQWLPRTFGEHDAVEAVPLFRLSTARLAQEVSAESTEMLLSAQPDWPASGRVQLGDEVLEYGAIASAPWRLTNLTRSEARQHPSLRVIHLLPDAPATLEWIAADHQAEILTVRAGAEDGVAAESVTDSVASLSGMEATWLSAPRLPLEARRASWTTNWDHPPDSDDWTFGTLTTALFPELAFEAGGDSLGARFSPTEDRLRATWISEELSRGARRFDGIVRARVAFEWSSSGRWAQDSRLQITVTRGGQSVVASLGESVPDQIRADAEGTAALPTNVERVAPGIEELERTLLLPFDRIDPLSVPDWQDGADAIGGTLDRWAEWDDPGPTITSEPLRLRVHIDRSGTSRGIRDLGIFARVRAVPSQDIRLRLFVPGHIDEVSQFSANDEWQTLGELLDANALDASDLLDDACVFEVEPTEPGLVQVSGAWLEARLLPAKVEVDDIDPPDSAPLDLEVRASAPFLPFEVDVTELLGDPPSWEMLHPGDPPLSVQFDLVAPSPSLEVRIRRTRWSFELFPATGVGATTRLFTHQRGLLTEADGACSPEAVIEALLLDARFGGLEPERVDLSAGLAGWNASGGRRFRAAVRDGRSLDTAFASAVAEGGALVHFDEDVWHVTSLEEALDLGELPLATASETLEFPAAWQYHPAPLRAGHLFFLRQDAPGFPHSHEIAETISGTETWALNWVESGTESLAEIAAACFARHPQGEAILPVHGLPGEWPTGMVITLATEPFAPAWDRAMVLETEWRDGRTWLRVMRLGE